ncbi:M50 family metallopeptidase [Clostridium cellulovorans]|uniref:M50 family metallopeptidase n=1 Tax=Clostridium cellulovorans TaxID=1493 RepID=UPI0001E8ED42|nr:M50 family metallopeptidase [Clostridium cellulovorans]
MLKINKYFIPYILLMVLLGFKIQLLLTVIFIFLHELAHYYTAFVLGFKGYDIEVSPLGTRLNLKELEEASLEEDIIISIAGPVLNIILAVLFYVLFKNYDYDILYRITEVNFVLAIFNLLPALPLDGGRLFRDILSCKLTYRKATYYSVIMGAIIGTVFFIIFIYEVINVRVNLNFVMMGIFFIFTAYSEYKTIAYVVMGDLMKKRVKFLKKGFLENRSLSVHHKQTILSAMGRIDKNKHMILWVLDDDMKLIDYICEEELLEAVKEYGNITLEEYYNLKEHM